MTSIRSHYSATTRANTQPGYNSEQDIHTIHPTHASHPSSPCQKCFSAVASRCSSQYLSPHHPRVAELTRITLPQQPACLALMQVTRGTAVISPHQPCLIVEDNPTFIAYPALKQVAERVNPALPDGTTLSHVTHGPKPTTPVIFSSYGGRGSQKDNNGHSLPSHPLLQT